MKLQENTNNLQSNATADTLAISENVLKELGAISGRDLTKKKIA